jgi:hypothetical protein
MAELRMRIFSNREKQQTHEELEEQVNEFLAKVYQVERVLQSGGDHFTTITVCYWNRPAGLEPGVDASLTELETELDGPISQQGGPAGSAETLSHTHELAAQGVRGLALEEGGTEHPGLDTTRDDLRRSSSEAHFHFPAQEEGGGGEGEKLAEAIAESLAEELSEPLATSSGGPTALEPAELAWDHACELHRLEDDLLTALEKLTAFRAGHPLSGPELTDFLLSEEMLVQMVEQVRAASEELASALRDYALRFGFGSWARSSEPTAGGMASAAGRGAASVPGDSAAVEDKAWSLPEGVDLEIQQLRSDLAELERQLVHASEKKDLLVSQLRGALESEDAERQRDVSRALELQQRRLAELRRDLRRVKARLGGSSGGPS